VAAVAHRDYRSLDVDKLAERLMAGACFIDVKAAFSQAELEARGLRVWRL